MFRSILIQIVNSPVLFFGVLFCFALACGGGSKTSGARGLCHTFRWWQRM
jgi:hypothetical protein